MQLSDYENKAIQAFGQSVMDGKWSNDALVSLLKVITDEFLNVKTISNYAENHKMTSQWARQKPDVFKIDGVQFIPDND